MTEVFCTAIPSSHKAPEIISQSRPFCMVPNPRWVQKDSTVHSAQKYRRTTRDGRDKSSRRRIDTFSELAVGIHTQNHTQTSRPRACKNSVEEVLRLLIPCLGTRQGNWGVTSVSSVSLVLYVDGQLPRTRLPLGVTQEGPDPCPVNQHSPW
jgi:hypothetical protein